VRLYVKPSSVLNQIKPTLDVLGRPPQMRCEVRIKVVLGEVSLVRRRLANKEGVHIRDIVTT
jgi:hypothetical protein